MPRQVDHKERKQQIMTATVRVLGERGVRGLSFRAVADELGGSTTMVTHYFPTQAELIAGLADSMVFDWNAEVSELEVGVENPYDRLALLLEWFVPTTTENLLEERARIAILAERLVGAPTEKNLDAWEEKARSLIRSHVKEIVPKNEVAQRVDMLRAMTNGLVLSVVEHPDHWTKKRLLKALRQSIKDMGLEKPE